MNKRCHQYALPWITGAYLHHGNAFWARYCLNFPIQCKSREWRHKKGSASPRIAFTCTICCNLRSFPARDAIFLCKCCSSFNQLGCSALTANKNIRINCLAVCLTLFQMDSETFLMVLTDCGKSCRGTWTCELCVCHLYVAQILNSRDLLSRF